MGSKVAPKLSDLFMEKVDRKILSFLKDHKVDHLVTILRYVDDYLIIMEQDVTDVVKKAFEVSRVSLSLTKEQASISGELQFLDLGLFTENGLCWRYQQKSEKPVVPYETSHSKIVKDATICNLISASVFRSCSHHYTWSLHL